MKVNIYETIEISDEQRLDLANVLDGEVNKPKRQATRDEIKEFVWTHGASWDSVLVKEAILLAGGDPEPTSADEPTEDDEEDLLGTSDSMDDQSDDGDEDLI